GSTRQMPHVSAPVPDVAPAGASAAIYWGRTGRYFFCAKAGGAISAPKKDRLPSIHARRVMVLIFCIIDHHSAWSVWSVRPVTNEGVQLLATHQHYHSQKIIQRLALQEVKFKNSFAFFCGWLRTILWRCARAGAIHLTGSLTSISPACDQ
ncbi:MAG: hypothetical protein EBT20_18335, partial [Alphaproteobacteria bacterium]|nr:hypothetical protein [Alphaproteobacteria bacterium]